MKLSKRILLLICINPSLTLVAVGIAVAGYPPRRSGRALLTHPAPTSGSGVEALHRIRVRYSGGRDPAFT